MKALAWTAASLAVIALSAGTAFALYGYRIFYSERILRLQEKSRGFPCIAEVLDNSGRRDDPALQVARAYLDTGMPRLPSLRWHFEFLMTTYVMDAFTSTVQLNRMTASLPMSPFADFDDAAMKLAGRRFCDLPLKQRWAIVEYWRGARREPLLRAFAKPSAA